jgi:hypothetical protein
MFSTFVFPLFSLIRRKISAFAHVARHPFTQDQRLALFFQFFFRSVAGIN